MTLTVGPKLGLLVHGAKGEVHYDELMQMWRGLDALIQAGVKSAVTTSPPASPVDGDCYIVPAGASGVWSGNATKVARYSAAVSAWEFYTPKVGWTVWNEGTSSRFQFAAGAWTELSTAVPTPVNNQTGTTYTFALSDSGSVVRGSNAAAQTYTVPAAFDVGTSIAVRQVGAGAITLSPAASVTLNIPSGYLAKTARQGSTIMLHKVATNEWDVTGDVAAP